MDQHNYPYPKDKRGLIPQPPILNLNNVI